MSNPRLNTPKLNDHRYMANIISSAIVNEPPPNTLADILNKRNKVHHLDEDTDEDMFPIFARDVDNAPRNNKRLMPRRNYCMLSLYDINRTSSLSLGTPDKKSSWSRRSKKGGIKKSQSIRSANSLPQNAVLDGAGDSREIMNFGSVMKDSLQVVLRVEINHKTPEGSTKPYRFIIPALESDKSDDIPKANVAKSI